MRWFRQHWLSHVARALPLAVLALALGAAAVLAHANAVRSAPAADAVLVDAPGDLAVWFDEAVDLRQSGIKLLDRSGQVLVEGRGSPTGERNSVGVALPPLGPGTYTAVWDNVAVDDGHANAGYYSFSVGRRDPALVITPAGESRSGSAGTISYRITSPPRTTGASASKWLRSTPAARLWARYSGLCFAHAFSSRVPARPPWTPRQPRMASTL
jgi:methionine-rich copper-binding protein CopC